MAAPDKSSANGQLDHGRCFPSRLRLFIESVGLASVVAVCAATITTILYYQGQAAPRTREHFIQSVVDDLAGMFVLLPIGLLLPTAWLMWAGCICVVATRKRAWLGLVVIGAIVFSASWHGQFMAMMSV